MTLKILSKSEQKTMSNGHYMEIFLFSRLRDLFIPGSHDSSSYKDNFNFKRDNTIVTKYSLTQVRKLEFQETVLVVEIIARKTIGRPNLSLSIHNRVKFNLKQTSTL
jgi:hypothetical protein